MKFVDSCEVDAIAGTGGNGCVAFRREKFVPFGGPSGGDGGRGGDVVFVADEGLSTLLDLNHVRALRAPAGEHGQGKDCYGRAGKELAVRVPVEDGSLTAFGAPDLTSGLAEWFRPTEAVEPPSR